MVKIDVDNSITIIKNDSNFILFRCRNHFKEVDRVVFNLTDKTGTEIYRKNLEFESGIIPLEIPGSDLEAKEYLYNLKICFTNRKQLTLIREKKFIVLEDNIKC